MSIREDSTRPAVALFSVGLMFDRAWRERAALRGSERERSPEFRDRCLHAEWNYAEANPSNAGRRQCVSRGFDVEVAGKVTVREKSKIGASRFKIQIAYVKPCSRAAVLPHLLVTALRASGPAFFGGSGDGKSQRARSPFTMAREALMRLETCADSVMQELFSNNLK